MKRQGQVIKLIFVCTALSAGAVLYFVKDARVVTFFPRCPFYFFTGFYCPGCGSQRAVSSLLHGQIVPALKFNILLIAFLPLLAYSATVNVLNVFNKKQLTTPVFYSPLFVKLVLIAVLAFAVLRNIPISPFTLLAPQQ